MSDRRIPSFAVILALALALGGCERGCLSRWLAEKGVGGAPRPAGSASGLSLEGTDCSDGLLRCVDGRVEASIAAHLPHPCSAENAAEARQACTCPWETIAQCSSGCVMDGLEVIGERGDGGAMQLCRPDAPVARPLLPGEPAPKEVCVDRGVTCVDGIVRVCEAPLRPTLGLAVCLHGCAGQVALDTANAGPADPGATTNPDGVVSILCRRDHAERR